MDGDAAHNDDLDLQDGGLLGLDDLLALASGHAPAATDRLRKDRRSACERSARFNLHWGRRRAQEEKCKRRKLLHLRVEAQRQRDQIQFHERTGYAKTDDYRVKFDAQRGAVGKASGKGKGSSRKRGAWWKRWTPQAILRGASLQPNSSGKCVSTSIEHAGNSSYFQCLKTVATCVTNAQRDGLKRAAARIT